MKILYVIRIKRVYVYTITNKNKTEKIRKRFNPMIILRKREIYVAG